jgi:hypothetical protein
MGKLSRRGGEAGRLEEDK